MSTSHFFPESLQGRPVTLGRRARRDGSDIIMEPLDIDAEHLDTHYNYVSAMTQISVEDIRLVDPLFVVIQTNLSALVSAFNHFLVGELQLLGRLHGVTHAQERKANLARILKLHTCSPICQSFLYIFKERSRPRVSLAWRSDSGSQPSGHENHTSVWRHSGVSIPDEATLHWSHPLRRAASNPALHQVSGNCPTNPAAYIGDGGHDENFNSGTLTRNDSSPSVATPSRSSQSTSSPSLEHLTPATDKTCLSVIKEWQQRMNLSKFIRRPCASCSGLSHSDELKEVDSRRLDLTVLRNDDIPISLLPSAYDLKEYDYAILEPHGMLSLSKRGPILLCKTCYSDINGSTMPRLALSNWLYYAREHVPAQIKKDFEAMSVFEKALTCRVRTNSLLCRFSLLQESTDHNEDFSDSRRHIKGNIISTPLDVPRLNSVLPPSPDDISDTLCALIVSHTPPTRATIDRLHPILVRKSRVKRIIAFLIAHNPHYQRSQSFKGFSSEFLDGLFEGPEDLGIPRNVRVGHLPVNEAVEAMMSDYTGRLDGLNGLFMENVSYTLGDRSTKSYREMTLLALQQCKEGRPFLHSSPGSSPVPDIDNPNWLSWAHPTADPFGIGGFCDPRRRRSITMQAQIRHLLNVQDPFFERDPVLTFDIYHIIRKGTVNTSLRFCVPLTAYTRTVNDISQTNAEVLSQLREVFRTNPNYEPSNPEELKILRTVSAISPIARKVPGSIAQRIKMRNEIRAIIGKRGSPTLFITLNPSDYHHPIVSVLARRPSNECEMDAILDLSSKERAQIALSHPVACAQFFDAMISGFIKTVLRCGTGKRKAQGVFGHCDAYYGTVETQGRGSLHCHMLIWLSGHLPPELLASKLKDSPEYRDKLCRWLDSIVDSGFLGSRSSLNSVTDRERDELQITEPHPGAQDGPQINNLGAKDFFKEANEHIDDLLLRFNWHVHTGSCWKYLSKKDPHTAETCRFGMDGVVRPETTINLEDGSVSLRRRHPKMTTYNPVTTFLLKCNTDVKFVGSGEEAKAFMYYVTDYITKAPLSMHAGLTALSYAIRQAEARGILTNDGIAEEDSRRAMTIAVNSMLGHQELSHPQVMSFILGTGESYTNERFQPVNWAEIKRYVSTTLDSGQEREGADASFANSFGSISLSVTHDGKDLSASNLLLDYVFRPPVNPYNGMGLYAFISRTQKHHKSPPANTSSLSSFHPFSSHLHPQILSHCLNLRRIAVTPVLLGPAIARRNGSVAEHETWSKDMCILFRPWRHPSEIKCPTESWPSALDRTLPFLSEEEARIVENMAVLPDAKKARDDRPRRRATAQSQLSGEDIDRILASNRMNPILEENVFSMIQTSEPESNPAISLLEHLIGAEAKNAFLACHPRQTVDDDNVDCLRDRGEDACRNNQPKLIQQQASFMAKCKPKKRSRLNKDKTSTNPNEGEIESDIRNDILMNCEYDPVSTVDALRGGRTATAQETAEVWDSIVQLAKDRKISLNPEQNSAFDIIAQHAVNGGKQLFLYIGGRGGTGKSYLIETVVELFTLLDRSEEIRLAAPTGIAASLIGGSTIHSLMQMSPTSKPTSSKHLASDWKKVKYLIVDEVSMIGAKLLATMSHTLKVAKADSELDSRKLFGGINVIFLGDFYQLSPPKQASLFSHKLVKKPSFLQTRNNDSLDAISGAYIWRQVEDVIILRKSKRHEDDPLLAELLDRIRANTCQDSSGRLIEFQGCNAVEHLRRREISHVLRRNPTELLSFRDAPVIVGSKNLRDALNACLLSAHAERIHESITLVFSTDLVRRNVVDEMTSRYLWNLSSRQTNDYLGQLPIFRGMNVMITENISVLHKVVNGSEGSIVDFKCSTDSLGVLHADVVYVKVKNCSIDAPGLERGVVPVFPVEATIEHVVSESGTLSKSFRRRQIPIIPAYSYTDYKSQGRTLDRAIVDITSARGQGVYVMLSRTKTLNGLLVLRWFPKSKILQRMSAELRDELKRLEELDARTLSLYNSHILAPRQSLRLAKTKQCQ